MKKLILLLLIVFSSCNGQEHSENLTLNGGTFQIKVEINNTVKIPFIIDTGASNTSIPVYVIMTLMKAGTVKQEDFLDDQEYTLADGSTILCKRVCISELKIGDKIIKDIECTVSENLGSPILLGQNSLRELGEVTVDYKNNLLKFN